jgi:hypothetical protein
MLPLNVFVVQQNGTNVIRYIYFLVSIYHHHVMSQKSLAALVLLAWLYTREKNYHISMLLFKKSLNLVDHFLSFNFPVVEKQP